MTDHESFRSFLASNKRLWLLPGLTVILLVLIMVLLTRDQPEAFVYTLN
ncbi:MAG: DUF5989 family protein [Myxococcota bacterium]